MISFAILPMKRSVMAKSRLDEYIPDSLRRALAEAMFTDALTALTRCDLISANLVVTSDDLFIRTAESHGATVIDDSGSDSHSSAAMLGIKAALEAGADRVLLVPGDCPLLDPKEITDLLTTDYGRPSFVVVPDRHGDGTNALLIDPPDAVSPAFGPGSRARHEALATDAGITARIKSLDSLALDVDTPADLAELRERLSNSHGAAAHTRGLLVQATRAGAFD